MTNFTRAGFLGRSAAALGALFFGAPPELQARSERRILSVRGTEPDLVLVNGRIFTIDDRQPRAEAFAVKNGRFTAIGKNDQIHALTGPETEIIDAAGMTVTPGFIDAHSHPSWAGLAHLTQVDTNLGSIARIQQALRRQAAELPRGRWVVGFMYDDTKLSEGRPLTRRDLDEAVPEHPVSVTHRGGHTTIYNSRAFELAGVTVDTPDPEGGHFFREDGELTGKVAELANAVFERLIPSDTTREQRQAGVKRISEMMTATGVTSVHDTGIGSAAATAYQDAYAAGELGLRAYLFPSGGSELYRGLRAGGIRTGFGDEWVRIGAVKYAADGSASERTMRMSTPYQGRPGDFGILTMTQEEIDDAVADAHGAGWQVGIHANGDVAIDMVLDAYARVQQQLPRPDPRHRIEHATLVNPDLLRRMKDLGVIPTPFYTYAHYHGEKWKEYGAAKLEWMFPHKSYLDYGIPVAGASDYPPGPFEPMMAIQSMVTRKDFSGRVWGPSQRISVEQALRVLTINGAHASFEEDLKGSITPGKLADFVILGEDPHDAEPDRIKQIPVVRTVVGGRTMHALDR